MSEAEYFETQSDSFWEIGQFKRTVKRTEDGYKLCNDLMQMLSERASLEKLYSKSLKSWAKKWNEYLEKTPEYGTAKATWSSITTEAHSLSEMHLKMHDDIEEQLISDVKAWQKQNYQKTIMNTLKIAKQYEDEFTKAQKPWAKKYLHCEKAKKEYHSQCKQLQSAKIQESNSKSDQALTMEQRKKYEDKAEKCRKEVENAKHKYEQSLEDLDEYNPRYIEDMKTVYKKCDVFEKSRLDFFIQKFAQVHGYLDLTQKPQLNSVYGNFMQTIRSSNPDKDLLYWSKTNGTSMAMYWPAFEEYSEELKSIGRVSKSSKLMTDENGVTITAIKHNNDQMSETSGLKSIRSHDSKTGTYPAQINPFSDFDDEFSDNDDRLRYQNIIPHQEDRTHNNKNNESKTNKADESNPFGDSDDDDTANNNRNSVTNNNAESYLNIKVRAVYDYHSTEDDELSFKAGEEFTKLKNQDDRGWCLGKLNGRTGLYPATYAHEI